MLYSRDTWQTTQWLPYDQHEGRRIATAPPNFLFSENSTNPKWMRQSLRPSFLIRQTTYWIIEYNNITTKLTNTISTEDQWKCHNYPYPCQRRNNCKDLPTHELSHYNEQSVTKQENGKWSMIIFSIN